MSFLDEIEAAVATLPQDQQVIWMRFRVGCTKVCKVYGDSRQQAFFSHPDWVGPVTKAMQPLRVVMLIHNNTLFAKDFAFHDTALITYPWVDTLSEAMADGIERCITPRFCSVLPMDGIEL